MSIDLISILLGGGGILGILSYIMSWRANKRIKNAEATEKEIQNLQSVVDGMRGQVDYLTKRVGELQLSLSERDKTISRMYSEQFEKAIKYAQKKGAITGAYSCQYSNDCPVLQKLKEFEESNLKTELKKSQNNEQRTEK